MCVSCAHPSQRGDILPKKERAKCHEVTQMGDSAIKGITLSAQWGEGCARNKERGGGYVQFFFV